MSNIFTIFQKEVNSFLNSLIAYVVIAVFLTGVGLFFWVFPNNLLESGYASLDTLFEAGPYLFLFLVPAITMRAFSEEMKSRTMEFLVTKPITTWQIIVGKYLAAVFLVFFSLLPTLLYFISVWMLGNPVGNLDVGASIGAYIGLFFLGSIFAAIGIFTSSLTDNQIIAFILGLFLCFVFYQGFEFLAGIQALDGINAFLLKLGINDHYQSISRGVIDSRDALYFFSFVSIGLVATRLVLEKKSLA
ncbi:MAG: gliding motility-associated ABC transporter permease subunit GldF [Bacteroidota bacterium]